MADDDEIDVLLAASEDEKSDWILDSGSASYLCRDREVFSTYAVCEERVWMAYNTTSRVVGRGSVRFCMADGRSVTLTEGELLSDMGPVVLPSRVDKGSNRCTEKSGQTRVMQPVQDVHREAQRKETKSILRSRTAKGAATPKRVSFALDLISGDDLSSWHLGEEVQALRWEVEYPIDKARYLGCYLAVLWRSWIRSYQDGRLEDVGLPSSGLEREIVESSWMSPSPLSKPKPDWSSYGVSM
ncbi:hypothetical protein Acr_18g0007240 [Actinidia rufa]|uniref:Retrovirus-related Pol polyprotein from transposon TNT 1-94-like beta-barrel domain-containing protein n=1 Tax=Actinidia rufa TaxID=165716 RepID=A0A7J0G6X9_9ERIC|nr:hypothetical protein Acr_18g0007240 [Actinidia rufa]